MNKGIEIDTALLSDSSNDLLNELIELETQINNFFKKLNTIPESGEWTGINAEMYANLVIQDKEEYLSYIEGLKELAQQMKTFAENAESAISESEKEYSFSTNSTGSKAYTPITSPGYYEPVGYGSYSSKTTPSQSNPAGNHNSNVANANTNTSANSNTTVSTSTNANTSPNINMAKYDQTIHTKKNASSETVSSAGQITTNNQRYTIVPDSEYKGDRGTISESDYNLLIAQVAGESANSPDDMLAVTSTVLNRLETGNGFGDSVNEVFEKGYFPWGRTYQNYVEGGKYYNTDWGQEKLAQVTEVVNDALNGTRNINSNVYYYSGNGEYNNFSDKA